MSISTYMNYMTESERTSFIAEKTMMDEFEKLNTLYEMCNLQQKIHNIDIENKVLTENGSYDDYAILLMEANEQVSQEKKGILAKIFDWFSNVFEAIHNAIASIFSKKVDPNAEIEIKQGLMDPEFMQLIDQVVQSGKAYAAQILTATMVSILSDGFKKGIGATIGKIKGIVDKALSNPTVVKVKASVGQGIMNKVNKVTSVFTTMVGNFNKLFTGNKLNNPDDANKVQKILSSIGDGLNSLMKGPIDAVKDAFNKAPDANANQTDQNANGQNNTNQNSANQNNNNQANGNAGTAANANQGQVTGAQQGAQTGPAPAQTAANNAGQAGQAQPVNASADTEPITDNELSMYESVFGKLDEKKEDDISDLLNMI